MSLDTLSQLIVLGDSYSDIGWTYPRDPLPTPEWPLGKEHPGEGVFWSMDNYQDSWVIHLSRSFQRRQQYVPIYDFAIGGCTVPVLGRQVEKLRMATQAGHIRADPNGLVVIWIGINDVCVPKDAAFRTEMDILDGYLREIHAMGLRNLVMFDVPPRKPSNAPQMTALADRITLWNTHLPSRLRWFEEIPYDLTPSTARLFSTHRIFKTILERPLDFGFTVTDPRENKGGIWMDGLHPSAKVHQILAGEVESWLASGNASS